MARILSVACVLFVTVYVLKTTEGSCKLDDVDQLPARLNKFAASLYLTTKKLAKPNESFVVSPLSVATSLGMLLYGADERTANEILKVLHSRNYCKYLTANAIGSLVRTIKGSNKEARAISSGLYVSDNYSINPDFEDIVKSQYGVNLGNVSYLIEDIIPPDPQLVLVHDASFFGDLEFVFKPRSQQAIKRKSKVFMTLEDHFNIHEEEDKFTLIEIPYKDRKTSILFLLPEGDLDQFENDLTPDDLAAILNTGLSEEYRVIYMFEFLSTYYLNLKQALKRMGIRQIFKEKRLPRIAEDVSVSGTFHRVSMKVVDDGIPPSEKPSGASHRSRLLPRSVNIKDSFIFFIRDNQTKVILASGRIAKPSRSRG